MRERDRDKGIEREIFLTAPHQPGMLGRFTGA